MLRRRLYVECDVESDGGVHMSLDYGSQALFEREQQLYEATYYFCHFREYGVHFRRYGEGCLSLSRLRHSHRRRGLFSSGEADDDQDAQAPRLRAF